MIWAIWVRNWSVLTTVAIMASGSLASVVVWLASSAPASDYSQALCFFAAAAHDPPRRRKKSVSNTALYSRASDGVLWSLILNCLQESRVAVFHRRT